MRDQAYFVGVKFDDAAAGLPASSGLSICSIPKISSQQLLLQRMNMKSSPLIH